MTEPAFERYARDVLAPAGIPWSVGGDATNEDYEGAVAQLGDQRWRVRTARITPRKPGAFLAFWRRAADGSTAPFPADAQDGLLVLVDDGGRRGGFSFTADQLERLGITSSAGHPGKRGFRVYPAWSADLNPQAARTQRSQAPAFFELD